MQISVVIPTCDRKERLRSLLTNLSLSVQPIRGVIIIDSGDDRLTAADCLEFPNLVIQNIPSEKSVCIQRNAGIRIAQSEWIFLCDDDIEMPADYLKKLATHIEAHPESGAVSGLVLQQNGNGQGWKADYPIVSARELMLKFIFQWGIWGRIHCNSNAPWMKKIKAFYARKGNHISSAGWPVVTDFSGDYFVTPVFGLGASLVKREWLVSSPYDEVLDKHGIGDNYGVALHFPASGIHVVNTAFVYHHQEPVNRLHRPLQYFRRVLALDYFRKTKQTPAHVKKYWLIWSLTGNLLGFLFVRDRMMLRPAFKSLWTIALGRNPYYRAAQEGKKVAEPVL